MKLKGCLFALLLFLAAVQINAQVTFPIDIHDGQTIETCSGFFVDSSGGDSLDFYQPGENYQIKFVSNDPERPHLKFAFELFVLAPGDTLFVNKGVVREVQAFVEDDLMGKTLYAATTTMTFHFVSHDPDNDRDEDNGNDDGSDERLGWKAEILCISPCDLFVVDIDPLDGLMNCPDAEGWFAFRAQAEYITDEFDFDPAGFTYSWSIGDATFEGQEIEYDGFIAPGAYSVNVTATDPETSCEASAYVVFMVGTVPNFDGTFLSRDTVCAEEQFTLHGFANPTQWTGFQTAVVEDDPVFLNHENPYASSLTFDVFDEALITEAEDIDRVCITIEHAEYRDVAFFLRSPDGVLLELKSPGGAEGPEVDFINLGEPVLEVDDIPGTGYEYCFAPGAWYGTMFDTSPQSHAYYDNAGNYYAFAYYMPVDGTYTPDQPFSDLAGSPLNGKWELFAEDVNEGSSGHVFGWRLMFNEKFYPDSLIFTPEIVQETWYQNGNELTGNPATAFVENPGDHDFLFEVTDNFGCTYDTLLTIHVLPLPEAEIVSELEIPVCEGDSTLLTVHPINNDGLHYLYQWQVNGVDLPESTYDTLMVKEPALYTVIVTDTITGCTRFFDLEVTEQNCDLTIPNVFTPNGDGINDEFEILNLEHYPNAQMIIFNRYGKRVFEHNDYYNNWWDGGNAPDGTYFYVLKYTRMGKTRYAEGSVTIIR